MTGEEFTEDMRGERGRGVGIVRCSVSAVDAERKCATAGIGCIAGGGCRTLTAVADVSGGDRIEEKGCAERALAG